MSRCKKCNKLMIFSRSSYCENCIKILETEASHNNKKDVIKEIENAYTPPISTASPKYYKQLNATFETCWSTLFMQLQNIRPTLELAGSLEAKELKQAGKYIESCKEYARAILRERKMSVIMIVGWAKTLCCGGSLKAANALYDATYTIFQSCNLLDLNNDRLNMVSTFLDNRTAVSYLIQSKNYQDTLLYLASISGNMEYTISPDQIDIFDE